MKKQTKDTYNKPLTERKKEYQKNGLDDATCQTCDQYPYSETDNHCPVCFVEIKSEVELEKDIKNDLYGTEVYGEREVG